MNAADYLSQRYIPGPGAPHFAQMVRLGASGEGFTLSGSFGDPLADGSVAQHMLLSGSGNDVFCPHWVSVRRVPAVAALSDEDREALVRAWPSLKDPEGKPRSVEDLDEGDLLLSVWPGAFQPLEQVWASLDLPLPGTRGRPQMPVPRYFLVQGLTRESVEAAAQAVVAEQFAAGTEPSLEGFLEGRTEVLYPVAARLGVSSETLFLSVFDARGLPIDPGYVFGTYASLTEEMHFLARPDAATAARWVGPRRHVFVFSDHGGRPYRPFTDPADPLQIPPVPASTPALLVTIGGTTHAIPDHGVLILGGLSTRDITRVQPFGEGVRFALEPHGTLSQPMEVGLHEGSFVRVRVVDYARWFPRNPNPKNRLQRYSEGNEYLPLADGRDTFRALYRAVRSTYEEVEYDHPDHDPPALGPVADPSRSQVLAIDGWYASHAPMLGRRAMLRTPRTQPGGMASGGDPAEGRFPKEASELARRFVLIPEERFPDGTAPPAEAPTSHRYWWIAPNGSLPPGSWLRVVQLDRSEDVVGTDPGDVSKAAVEDLYGAFVAVGKQEGFVGPQGQLAVPVTYDPAWAFQNTEDGKPIPGKIERLRLDAVIWEPDGDDPDPEGLDTAGKGRALHRAYGDTELLFPMDDPLAIPPFSGADLILGARLALASEVGHGRVVLPAGMITQPSTLAVLNPRSGDLWWRVLDPVPPGPVEVPVENLAYRDTLLVGFLPLPLPGAYPAETADGAGPDLSLATHLFTLSFDDVDRLSGAAAAHPREALGMARRAIDAGVDARLLAWRDDRGSVAKQIERSLGGVLGFNAPLGGSRGQALLDGLTRLSAAQHQKLAFIRNPREVLAFVGGIDQVNGRYDHPTHPEITPERPGGLWHDVHCRIRGLAALDVYRNFRDRWNSALAHPEQVSVDENWNDSPLDPALEALPDVDDPTDPRAPQTHEARTDGTHIVQINRTVAPRLDFFDSFLDPGLGETSIQASYERVIDEAREFIYIEDQYFFHVGYAAKLYRRLKEGKLRFVALLVPELLAHMPYLDLAIYAIRRRALSMLLYGRETVPENPEQFEDSVADKVAIFHIRNDFRRPIYVHAKCIIADDLWLSIGSANFIRRSMNFDSELNAAVIDGRLSRGGHRVVRDFRVALMAEHLRLHPSETPLLEDPMEAFRLIKGALEGGELRETGIYPADLRFTIHGEQPGELDGDFWDVIRLVIDPDGDELEVPGRLLTLVPLLNRLRSDPADPSFAAFGYLKVTVAFTDPAPADPADLEVSFEVWRDEADAERFHLGPFAADHPAQLALLEAGASYNLRATAALKTAPETVVAATTPPPAPFVAQGFFNLRTVSLSPV